MRAIITLLLLLACVALAVVLCVAPPWYIKNTKWHTDKATTVLLKQLGDSALVSADVPVAAVLLYDGKVIGTGYNTVRKDLLAGGHAEINAISNALRATGLDSFMHLNRNKLTLITTWQPCEMCKGAIIEYNIHQVVMLHPKSFAYQLKEWKKEMHYQWQLRSADTDTLQEHLFKKHPLYNKFKNEH